MSGVGADKLSVIHEHNVNDNLQKDTIWSIRGSQFESGQWQKQTIDITVEQGDKVCSFCSNMSLFCYLS